MCIDILFESSLRGRSTDLARPPRFFRRAALSLSLALSHFSLSVTEPYKLRATLAEKERLESSTVFSYNHFSEREHLHHERRKRTTSKKRGMDQRVQMAIPGQPAPNIKRYFSLEKFPRKMDFRKSTASRWYSHFLNSKAASRLNSNIRIYILIFIFLRAIFENHV